MIEVEKRGLIDPQQYEHVLSKLESICGHKDKDNSHVYFYIHEGLNIKINHQIDKGTAKLSVKNGDVTNHAVEESEVFFDPKQIESCINTLKLLGFDNYFEVELKRVNFEYKDTIISIKWSKTWGHHFEIEKCVQSQTEVESALQTIYTYASELDLTIMTDEEQEAIEHRIRYGK